MAYNIEHSNNKETERTLRAGDSITIDAPGPNWDSLQEGEPKVQVVAEVGMGEQQFEIIDLHSAPRTRVTQTTEQGVVEREIVEYRGVKILYSPDMPYALIGPGSSGGYNALGLRNNNQPVVVGRRDDLKSSRRFGLDMKVSGVHASITIDEHGAITITDSSTNGTRVRMPEVSSVDNTGSIDEWGDLASAQEYDASYGEVSQKPDLPPLESPQVVPTESAPLPDLEVLAANPPVAQEMPDLRVTPEEDLNIENSPNEHAVEGSVEDKENLRALIDRLHSAVTESAVAEMATQHGEESDSLYAKASRVLDETSILLQQMSSMDRGGGDISGLHRKVWELRQGVLEERERNQLMYGRVGGLSSSLDSIASQAPKLLSPESVERREFYARGQEVDAVTAELVAMSRRKGEMSEQLLSGVNYLYGLLDSLQSDPFGREYFKDRVPALRAEIATAIGGGASIGRRTGVALARLNALVSK